MVHEIITGLLYMCVGGIAANALHLFALATGGASEIKAERRLPSDSDSMAFCVFFAVGAACGLIGAPLFDFSRAPMHFVPIVVVSFAASVVVGLPWTKRLNRYYFARAKENFMAGNYRDAIEDAREVARSSERLRAAANQIIDAARARALT